MKLGCPHSSTHHLRKNSPFVSQLPARSPARQNHPTPPPTGNTGQGGGNTAAQLVLCRMQFEQEEVCVCSMSFSFPSHGLNCLFFWVGGAVILFCFSHLCALAVHLS